MTIKFDRDPKKPAKQQIAKLLIDLQKYHVTVWFHMEEGDISPQSREYSHDQIMGIIKNDSNQKKVDDPIVQQEHQKIRAMETDCYKYMKDREQTAANETKQMRLPVILEKTLYDKARDKFKQNLNHEDEEK